MSHFETDAPIFVRGMSRSGGTLMVTLLDAHPDVAMSYELYPHLLELQPEEDMNKLAAVIARSTNKSIIRRAPTKAIAKFSIRCNRGGLTMEEVGELVAEVAREGLHFSQLIGRQRMIEKCALRKMRRLGKKRWGMKCTNRYSDYTGAWAKAQFLDMLRDGRDVLASQLNTGSFKNSPEDVADGWRRTHETFENLMSRGDINGTFVRYEQLTSDPERELRRICDLLGLEFSDLMLRHEEQDLTVYSASHLSGDRISSKIDTSSVGRWKRDLSVDELRSIRKKRRRCA